MTNTNNPNGLTNAERTAVADFFAARAARVAAENAAAAKAYNASRARIAAKARNS